MANAIGEKCCVAWFAVVTHSESHPSVGQSRTTRKEDKSRLEWFKHHSIELFGLVVLIVYTVLVGELLAVAALDCE